jgi:hypothetical protein
MRVLSVRQPWADLIASGRKTLEVRSWSTAYRGPLVIAAAQRPWGQARVDASRCGVLVCLVELVDVRLGVESDRAAAGGVPTLGQWVWQLASPRALEARAWRGSLGLRAFDAQQLELAR